MENQPLDRLLRVRPMYHPMHIAYIVSAYRLPSQVVRLICRLQHPDTSFFVHVDKKCAPQVHSQIKDGVEHMDNVHLLARHECHWGEFGHVRASLKGLAAIVERGSQAQHAFILTGQDYPLQPRKSVEQFLSARNECSFIETAPLPHSDWLDGGMDRIRFWHCRILGRRYRLPMPTDGARFAFIKRHLNRWFAYPRPFLSGMRPYGGSGYLCLSREAIEFVLAYAASHPNFVRFFRHVSIPDELFFQTLLLNSHLKDTICNENLWYIDWPSEGRSPAILTMSEADTLLASSKLFARKFDETVDTAILDCLDAHLDQQATDKCQSRE